MRKKIAARLKQLIRDRPIIDLPGGPSRSYMYRLLEGQTNASIEVLDAICKAYGSNLGEFFEPWKQG